MGTRVLCMKTIFQLPARPAQIKKNMELWVGCVAGALSDYEYVAKLAKAGFDNIDIEPTRVYSIEDARAFLSVAEVLGTAFLLAAVVGSGIMGELVAVNVAIALLANTRPMASQQG
jgi:hypothetical protein